jgi:hypothetical protein
VLDTPALAHGWVLLLLLLRGQAHRLLLLPAALRWVLVARPPARVGEVQMLPLLPELTGAWPATLVGRCWLGQTDAESNTTARNSRC